jgi:hypothetical protein
MRTKTWYQLGAGLVGGLLGTQLMASLIKRAGKMPPSLRPVAPSQDPGDFMVGQAERVIGPLSPRVHSAFAHSLQWVYGSFWPLALSAVVAGRPLRSVSRLVATGTGLGALVWAVGALGWLPATKLTKPVYRQPIGGTLSNLIGHLAYGTLAALPLAALEAKPVKERIESLD